MEKERIAILKAELEDRSDIFSDMPIPMTWTREK